MRMGTLAVSLLSKMQLGGIIHRTLARCHRIVWLVGVEFAQPVRWIPPSPNSAPPQNTITRRHRRHPRHTRRLLWRRRIMITSMLASLSFTPIAQRLCGTSWRLRLSIGQEPDGARLAMTVDATFNDDAAPDAEALLGPSQGELQGTRSLSPLQPSTSFVGPQGTMNVPLGAHGAWQTETSVELEDLGVALNWFLDFPEGTERNGVTLPAGPLFFTGACWDAGALATAEVEVEQLASALARQTADADGLVAATKTGNPWERFRATRRVVLAREEEVRLETRLEKHRMSKVASPGSTAAPPRPPRTATVGSRRRYYALWSGRAAQSPIRVGAAGEQRCLVRCLGSARTSHGACPSPART